MMGAGAAFYGSNSPTAIRQAALRIRDIVNRIGSTTDVQEAMALNTYARAELVRLIAARTRLQAARIPWLTPQKPQRPTQNTDQTTRTHKNPQAQAAGIVI